MSVLCSFGFRRNIKGTPPLQNAMHIGSRLCYRHAHMLKEEHQAHSFGIGLDMGSWWLAPSIFLTWLAPNMGPRGLHIVDPFEHTRKGLVSQKDNHVATGWRPSIMIPL